MDVPTVIEAPASPSPSAESRSRTPSGWFAEAAAGPAFATYGAVDQADVAEHLATGGSAIALGAGYGIELLPVRVDVGLRIQHFRIGVRGAYDAKRRDDAFRANYDYVFPTVSATATTKWRSRVNVFVGLSIGSATFISDRQGASIHARQLPVFGTFEGGLQLSAMDWLDVRAAISWLPPFQALNVVSPTLGVRARF